MTSYIILLTLIFTSLVFPANAAETLYVKNKAQSVNIENIKIIPSSTIKGSITESKELPSELYGAWFVSTQLVKADNSVSIPKKTLEIWKLEEIDGKITLINPTTRAHATITVDNVQSNTATFSRKKNTIDKKEHEKVTITIEKDIFYGNDIQTTKSYNKGELLKTEVAEYQLKGTRIINPVLREIFAE